MKILALEKEILDVPAELSQQHGKAEAQRVWELVQQGVIRETYFRDDSNQAVLVLECPNLQDARHILATLPLVAHGVIEFDLIGLRAYPGFSRLFERTGV